MSALSIKASSISQISGGIVQFSPIDFDKALVDYFSLYQQRHTLDYMNLDAKQIEEIRSRGIFHGLLIAEGEGNLKEISDHIRGLMVSNFGNFGSTFVEDGIYNRAGNFVFLDVASSKKTIDQIIRSRIFDIVVMYKIVPESDMISTLKDYLVDKEIKRIISIL